MNARELLRGMRCPGLSRTDLFPPDVESLELSLSVNHLPPMPAEFMPEFSTMLDVTGAEVRIGVAYGSPQYPGDRGTRWALCYLLSSPDWREGRSRQEQSDAYMRAYLWLIMRAADVVNASELCKSWIKHAYPCVAVAHDRT